MDTVPMYTKKRKQSEPLTKKLRVPGEDDTYNRDRENVHTCMNFVLESYLTKLPPKHTVALLIQTVDTNQNYFIPFGKQSPTPLTTSVAPRVGKLRFSGACPAQDIRVSFMGKTSTQPMIMDVQMFASDSSPYLTIQCQEPSTSEVDMSISHGAKILSLLLNPQKKFKFSWHGPEAYIRLCFIQPFMYETRTLVPNVIPIQHHMFYSRPIRTIHRPLQEPTTMTKPLGLFHHLSPEGVAPTSWLIISDQSRKTSSKSTISLCGVRSVVHELRKKETMETKTLTVDEIYVQLARLLFDALLPDHEYVHSKELANENVAKLTALLVPDEVRALQRLMSCLSRKS